MWWASRVGLTYWEETRAPLVARRIKSFSVSTGGTALDVGCGSGALTRQLAIDFERVVGVDIDIPRLANQTLGAPFLIAASATSLPIKSRSIKFVFSYGALHHTNVRDALLEISRVLAPGGSAVLIDFYAVDGASRTGYFQYLREVVRFFGGYRQRLGVVGALRISMFRLSWSWFRHIRSDSFLTADEFVAVYSSVFSNAEFRKEDNIMTVIWRKSVVF